MCSGTYKKLFMAGMDEEGGIRLAREEGGMRQTLCIVLRALELYRPGRAIRGLNGRSVHLGGSYWIYCGLLEWGK